MPNSRRHFFAQNRPLRRAHVEEALQLPTSRRGDPQMHAVNTPYNAHRQPPLPAGTGRKNRTTPLPTGGRQSGHGLVTPASCRTPGQRGFNPSRASGHWPDISGHAVALASRALGSLPFALCPNAGQNRPPARTPRAPDAWPLALCSLPPKRPKPATHTSQARGTGPLPAPARRAARQNRPAALSVSRRPSPFRSRAVIWPPS
jgi:hypothetical protein